MRHFNLNFSQSLILDSRGLVNLSDNCCYNEGKVLIGKKIFTERTVHRSGVQQKRPLNSKMMNQNYEVKYQNNQYFVCLFKRTAKDLQID